MLNKIIENSDYGLTQFSDILISAVENNVTIKIDKNGNDVYYISCPYEIGKLS